MDWSEELHAFTWQCPCGDLFQITMVRLPRLLHEQQVVRFATTAASPDLVAHVARLVLYVLVQAVHVELLPRPESELSALASCTILFCDSQRWLRARRHINHLAQQSLLNRSAYVRQLVPWRSEAAVGPHQDMHQRSRSVSLPTAPDNKTRCKRCATPFNGAAVRAGLSRHICHSSGEQAMAVAAMAHHRCVC
jgi:hypothetical protein